jgi:hypothetical protein
VCLVVVGQGHEANGGPVVWKRGDYVINAPSSVPSTHPSAASVSSSSYTSARRVHPSTSSLTPFGQGAVEVLRDLFDGEGGSRSDFGSSLRKSLRGFDLAVPKI